MSNEWVMPNKNRARLKILKLIISSNFSNSVPSPFKISQFLRLCVLTVLM